MNKTLNQVLEVLKEFSKKHILIKSSGFGTYSMLNTFVQNNDNLPLLYFQLDSFNPSEGENDNIMSYSFTVKVLDSRSKNKDNFQDLLSDTSQILIDLKQYLIYNFDNLELWLEQTDDMTATPLVNSTNDWLTGFQMNLKIYSSVISSDCLVPLNVDTILELYVSEGYVLQGYFANN
jgi:hypothetical protein